MKLRLFLRNIKFEKPDRDTVRSVDRLLMFIGVLLHLLYYGGKVAPVVFVGVQLDFCRFIYIGATSRWGIIKTAMGL